MPLAVGMEVIIRPLGSKRGTVVSARGRGRYLVQVEGVAVSCREEDLAAAAPASRKKSKRRSDAPRSRPASAPGAEKAPPVRVDLHGLRVEEALARTTEAINDALLRGADRMEIVHGKGSGRVRTALHRQLATMTVVVAFRLDERNPGVTWVYF